MSPLRSLADDPRAPADAHAGRNPAEGRFAGGGVVVDRRGNILAFDRGMEALTGWQATDVVGQSQEFGFYHAPDELGVRRYDRHTLFDGALPEPERTALVPLRLNCRDGGRVMVEALVTPIGRDRARLAIEVQRVLTRSLPASPPQGGARQPAPTIAYGTDLFDRKLTETFERIRYEFRPLSILLIDVDGYAEIIAEDGPDVADDCLRRAASIVQALIQQGDSVSRVKPDGFAVILEGADRKQARHVGGRIRQTIEGFNFARPTDSQPLRVSVSVGIASYPADGDNPHELVRRCREALHEACRIGRNRVWCYARRPRVPIRVPVQFDGPASRILGHSRDLSHTGMFIETDEELRVGMRLGLSFLLPGQQTPVRCVGRVTRRVAAWQQSGLPRAGVGVEFERYTEYDRRRIEELLHRVRAEPAPSDRSGI